jgi:small conductance mechanosensitive channel
MPLLPGTQPKAAQEDQAPAAASNSEPFRVPTLSDLQDWVKAHGLSILAIVVVVAATLWLAGLLEGRIVRLLARGDDRGSVVERENRARTLVGVLNNALRTAALTIGAIMVLKEFAIPIEPLLGGVAVIGLAVAFGAQSLIKDYFTGFMVHGAARAAIRAG